MPTEPASQPPAGGLRGLLALPNEDPRKLVTLALSLCLVTVRNRTWRLAWWGHFMSHAGVVVVPPFSGQELLR